MKRKNAFTLIELLAIIVILAIIAVITVPIILNIIENAKIGSATDSAYGYKDSINKWYVSKLSETGNDNLKLEGTYTVTNGVLNGTGINEKIPVSGTEPTSGSLTYENGVFKNGCLTIGDYKVTFNTDGTTSAEKGECEELVQVSTIETCPGPGCVYAYTTDTWYYSGTPTTLTSAQYKENYEDVISESGKKYFLGLKLNASGTIERAFACGIEGTTPFCLEATTDKSKYSDNVEVLKTIFPSCRNISDTSHQISCGGYNTVGFATGGEVTVSGAYGGNCDVHYYGAMSCREY